MSQFEQENDLGRGGGEVDEKTMEKAWDASEERLGDAGDDPSGRDLSRDE